MKKIFLTMVAIMAMTAAVAQQSDNNKGERKGPKQPTPAEMTERMSKELSLSEDQKAKVLALNKEYQDMFKGGPRMGGGRPPKNIDGQTGASEQQEKKERPQLTDAQKQEMKQKMEQQRAKHEEYNAKLKNILTDDQYTTYQKMHQRHGKHGKGGMGGMKGKKGKKGEKSMALSE